VSGSVLPVAGSARFRRRVRVQGNGPRASRLRASDVSAVPEQCAGDATRRSGPAGGYASVPAVFQWHTCVSRGSSAREQEDPEVREGVGIANHSAPSSRRIIHDIQQFLPSWIAQPLSPRVTTETTPSAIFHPRQPFPANSFVIHGISSSSSFSLRRFCSPREFTFHPFSSTTKATPRFALIH
jgi:hypothetical protein